jgi:hypothetical protein
MFIIHKRLVCILALPMVSLEQTLHGVSRLCGDTVWNAACIQLWNEVRP